MPRGMEALMALAAARPSWREKVLADPLNAAAEADVYLTGNEQSVLASIPPATLEQMINSFDRRTSEVRTGPLRFGRATVAAAALLAAGIAGSTQGAPTTELTAEETIEQDLMYIGIAPDLPSAVQGTVAVLVLKRKKTDSKVTTKDLPKRVEFRVQRAIRGKTTESVLVFDLQADIPKGLRNATREFFAANSGVPALMLLGYSENTTAKQKVKGQGYLHIGGRWFPCTQDTKAQVWYVGKVNHNFNAMWAGGTDMLIKAIELLATHPQELLPQYFRVDLDAPVDAGRVKGHATGMLALDTAGKGGKKLFIASDAGDRLLKFDARTSRYVDMTAGCKLMSKSKFFAWGCFSGTERLDLISYDGRKLRLWAQQTDGTFSKVEVKGAPAGPCHGLTTIDAGHGSRAGIVLAADTGTVLLEPDKGTAGKFNARTLKLAEGTSPEWKHPAPPLSADFDGDGHPDILQIYEGESFLFKGTGSGRFAPGVACSIKGGKGRTVCVLGDFDMNGRIDVLSVSESTADLWQNMGGGKFVNVIGLCGELSWSIRMGAVAGNACDVANTGLRGLFLAYPDGEPLAFGNRGFRSLLRAELHPSKEGGRLPPEQQTALMADLNGDHHQDMAVVLPDGTLKVFHHKPQVDAPRPVLEIALGAGSGTAGPVVIKARTETRSLGCWSTSPGKPPARFALPEPGAITVTWQLPGKKPQKKVFEIEGGFLRYVIGGE